MRGKIIPIIIMITGLFVFIYPNALDGYHMYQQQRFIEEWQQSLATIDHGMILLNEEEQTNVNPDAIEEINQEIEHKNKENEKNALEEYIKNNMEGMLKIEKINLSLPILKGATEKNLKISLASIENTGKAGEIGNFAIAGHRNRTYGRNFNRLDEVEVGDVVEVHNGEKQYKYTVTDKLYVKPEEVWVLYGNKKEKEITLITCHPMIKPTHRLVIKGKSI